MSRRTIWVLTSAIAMLAVAPAHAFPRVHTVKIQEIVGLYCTGTAWRHYADVSKVRDSTGDPVGIPSDSKRVTLITDTHEVVESALESRQNEGHGVFIPVTISPKESNPKDHKLAKRGRGTLTFDGAYTVEIYPLIIDEPQRRYLVLSTDFVRGKGTEAARVLGQGKHEELRGVEIHGQVENLDFVNAKIQAKIRSNDDDESRLLPLFSTGALPEGVISGLSYHCQPATHAPLSR